LPRRSKNKKGVCGDSKKKKMKWQNMREKILSDIFGRKVERVL
jgi:hypothetical protein